MAGYWGGGLKPTTLVWVMFGLVGFSVLFTLWLGIFDFQALFGMLIIFGVYGSGYMYLRLSHLKKEKAREEKKRIDYCWDRVNDILRGMSGGTRLEWMGGRRRRSELTYRYEGNKKNAYRVMFGRLTRYKQNAIIIYGIEEDDIMRFETNPGPDLLDNPWKGFDPFQQRERMAWQTPSHQRGGGKGPKLTINYGGGQNDYDADDDFLERALPKPSGDDDKG